MTHIDPDSRVTDTVLGENCTVWNYCTLLTSKIGNNVHIGAHTEIKGAVIGNDVHIGSGAFICDGIIIEDKCFIGPKVCFTNDKNPIITKEHYEEFQPMKTLIKTGARIGANCTILPGIEIGEYALVGAGSVVTKNIPAFEVWVGNPARRLHK